MFFTRENEKIEIKEGQRIILVDEILPIVMRYPVAVQKVVLSTLAPLELVVKKGEENG